MNTLANAHIPFSRLTRICLGLWLRVWVCIVFVILPCRWAAASEPTSAPLYDASPPATMTLHYLLQRGILSGEGELVWRPEGSNYSLSLTGSVAGFRVLQQSSLGTLSPHGLAPTQFSDRRGRGTTLTATLNKDQGLILYSNGAPSAPWSRGAQDRLSWMIQLPSIINRLPTAASPGQTIDVFVTGARGDADIWRFRFVGTENVVLSSGKVPAAKWVREPRRLHDSSIEVWLDPAHQHLPLRAKLTFSDGEPFELLLHDNSRTR